MTITYTNSIPAPNNNPSDDQPDLRNNTDALDTIIGVDHYSFNEAAGTPGGTHKQITFPATNVPVPPTTPPILFTETVAGLAQLKFYSGDAAHSSNQYVAAATGSTFALGGIIIKWGNVNLPGTGFDQPVTFGVAFPNNCFSAVTSTSDRAITVGVKNGTVSTTGFTATKSSSSASLNVYYIAIGN